jgi:hypothetical protein
MADGYFMPKEKYEWLTGAVDRLTKDHDAATSHAERATVEVKAATKLLVTAWSERDAATARAERAEEALAEVRAQLAKALDALAAGSALRERFVQRALAAEATIGRVRALHSPEPGWERQWKDPAEALANGWPMCAGCATTATVTPLKNCRTIAALDAQRPAEERAECGCPIERRPARVLSHTRECSDRQAVERAVASLADLDIDEEPPAQRPAEGGPEEALTNCCPCDDCEVRRRRALEGGPEGEGAATGVDLIAAERRRQVEAKGWTPEHDAEHTNDQLARAAACYAMPAMYRAYIDPMCPADWPWHRGHWKPGNRLRELAKAGALIAAEIDRLAALDGGQPATEENADA